MSTPLHTIEAILPRLTASEKAQVLELIARDLAGTLGGGVPGVDRTSGVCGGAARVVRTRIPIWTLERARRLGISEADLLNSFPTLTGEDLANAWAYVRLNGPEIERAIAENEA